MITKTPFFVSLGVIEKAQKSIPNDDYKLTLNDPTGRFFYDPWIVKNEFKNTVWETILETLPKPLGEARIIQMQNGTCYMSHCDIDDRYHLNIDGEYSFLIDIDSQKMYPTIRDGSWYLMNTGFRHVAANFGSICRLQLVVRKLLNESKLKNPISIKIHPICANPRFEFDNIISPWLNKMNKLSLLRDFRILDNGVSFELEKESLKELDVFPKEKFEILK